MHSDIKSNKPHPASFDKIRSKHRAAGASREDYIKANKQLVSRGKGGKPKVTFALSEKSEISQMSSKKSYKSNHSGKSQSQKTLSQVSQNDTGPGNVFDNFTVPGLSTNSKGNAPDDQNLPHFKTR